MTSARTRVLHVYSDNGTFGGIERAIETLAVSAQRDPTVEFVAACTEGGPLYARLRKLGVRTHGLRATRRLSHVHLRPADVALLAQTARIGWLEKPDVVHVHIGHWEHLPLRLTAKRLIYTFHGYGSLYRNDVRSEIGSGALRALRDARSPRDRLVRAGKGGVRLLLRRFLAASDAVTVVSSAELRRLQTEGYMPQSAKVRVVPSPIDVQRIRQAVLAQDRSAARRSFGVRETDSAIVWFGRMEPGKDPELAIRTTELLLERLNGTYKTPVLLLAGDGSLVAELRRRIASSKHAANLRMVGRLDDVTPLLAAADIALFTSESEGFGLALVEAAAAGVPLVTTEVGAAPDLLRGGAKPLSQCLATARDVEGFAGKAAALLSIPAVDRDALADALRHRALGFDSPQVWQRMREIYLDAPDADNARASVDELCA